MNGLFGAAFHTFSAADALHAVGILMGDKAHFAFAFAKTAVVAAAVHLVAEGRTFVKEPQKYAEWAKILAKGPIKHQRQQKYTGKAKQFDEQKQAMELLPVGKNHQRHQNHQQQKENIFPLSPPLLLGQILEFLREGDLKNQPLENPQGTNTPTSPPPTNGQNQENNKKNHIAQLLPHFCHCNTNTGEKPE